MSKATLAIIAAASAATGAAATAILYTTSSRTKPSTSSPLPSAEAPTSSPPPPTRTSPVNPAGIFNYTNPGPFTSLSSHPSQIALVNFQTRNPYWVAEHITRESLSLNEADRRHSQFAEDPSVPEKFRAKLSDYSRSGYDRGHQTPAADAKWSQDAMNGTFFLSNMCPQVGDGFNRDYWAHLEDFVRRLTAAYPSVRVVTGPLYLPKKDPTDGKWRVSYEVIGSPPNVAVPTHFYKIIYGENKQGADASTVALGAFVLPNAPIDSAKPLTDFEVPLEAVERASGLEFGAKLPNEKRRRLCQEVQCSLVVKNYAERQNSFRTRQM